MSVLGVPPLGLSPNTHVHAATTSSQTPLPSAIFPSGPGGASERGRPDPAGVAVHVLEQILQATTDGVWIIDNAGCTLYANRRVGEVLRLAAVPAPGLAEFYTVMGVGVAAVLLRGVEGSGAECYEFRCESGGGRLLRVAGYPYLNPTGRQVGRILIFKEVVPDIVSVAGVLRGQFSAIKDVNPSAIARTRPVALSHGLSRGEAQVAAALLHGCSLAAIAEDLGLSIATVRGHVESMCRTFGVHSQSALMGELEALNAAGTIGVSGIRAGVVRSNG